MTTIQIGAADIARVSGARLLPEPPEPPRRVHEGVVNDGLQRWRLKRGALVCYFLYRRNERQRIACGPWKAYWTVPGYVG